MTRYIDGHEFEVDVEWIDGNKWSPYCNECIHYEHTYCDNPESDHYGHYLATFHRACPQFEEE